MIKAIVFQVKILSKSLNVTKKKRYVDVEYFKMNILQSLLLEDYMKTSRVLQSKWQFSFWLGLCQGQMWVFVCGMHKDRYEMRDIIN